MPVLELLLRITIAFFTLLTLARIMGRKEISQMTFFNFISGMAIATIAASLAIDSSLSIKNGLIALVGWSAITIILGYLDIKSKKIRLLIEGQPLIVIKSGKVMVGELRKARLDMDALNALLSHKNIFSITEVNYAIFEIDGKLSVLKKEAENFVTNADLNIQKRTDYPIPISTSIISDGNVLKENIKELNLSLEWLDHQLLEAGIDSVKSVFYAEVQKDGTLYIDKSKNPPK